MSEQTPSLSFRPGTDHNAPRGPACIFPCRTSQDSPRGGSFWRNHAVPNVIETTYHVRRYRGSTLVKDLGRTVRPTPQAALHVLASEFIARGWQYHDNVDASGSLVSPDGTEHVDADPEFPPDEED